jgi:hypothetical protein
VVPAAVEVVKLTVAWPLASVVEVAVAKEPPVPLFDQVTVRPLVETAFPFASASCASTVTALPATGEAAERVTRYFVAAPGTLVALPLVPVRAPSVAVNA